MMAINKKHSSEQFLPVSPKIDTQIDYWLPSECIHRKSMFDCPYYIEMIEWQRCQDTSVEHPFHGNSPDWHSWSWFEWHGWLSANFRQTRDDRHFWRSRICHKKEGSHYTSLEAIPSYFIRMLQQAPMDIAAPYDIWWVMESNGSPEAPLGKCTTFW